MHHESLPFTIAPVRNQRDLQSAVRIRHAACRRRVPELAQTLRSGMDRGRRALAHRPTSFTRDIDLAP